MHLYLKNNYTLIITIALLFNSCSNKLKYLKRFDGFKSNPKYVEVKTYKVLNNDTTLKNIQFSYSNIYQFDKEGRLLIDHGFNSKGNPIPKWRYDYDQEGNILKTKTLKRFSPYLLTISKIYN